MRDYIDITGKTEEEAIRKGLEKLGLDRDEVSVEILERAKAGFLGFGSAPAKIRMSYGEDKPEPQPEPVQPETPSAPEEKPVRERRERRRNKKPVEAAEVPAETHEIPAKSTEPVKASKTPGEPAPEAVDASQTPETAERPRRGRQRRKSKASDAKQTPKATDTKPVSKAPEQKSVSKAPEAKPVSKAAEQKPVPVPENETVPTEEVNNEKATAIRAFLSGLLEHMDIKAEIRVYQPEEGRYKVILEGAGMGALIGRRGETLDAIQQLTNYSVNRNGVRVRIQLDAEGYREKREQSLRNLARKEAAKVVKYRRSRTLEPMNAYERHVIHTALQEFPGVNTYSTGVDPNRRVVIAFDRETV